MKTIAGRLIKIAFIVIMILALGAGCAPSGRSTLPVAEWTPGSRESGYADLNGLRMYYEIQGTDRPLGVDSSRLWRNQKRTGSNEGPVTAWVL